MAIQCGQKVLLTGAGFTHNFGAPLSAGMWEEIFNQPRVQANPGVRNKLAGSFDFERVYNTILIGDDNQEKQVITEAVFAAYDKLDGIVTEYYKEHGSYDSFSYQDLIAKFGGQSGRRFFFTLNQDLFIERGTRTRIDPPPLIRPGIDEQVQWDDFSAVTRRLKETERVRLPSPDELASRNGALLADDGFFYIKLHGSQDWLSFDGERRMVLGRGKENQIEREPLLKQYLEVFRQALFAGGQKLLVIGYGFGDEHINRTIAEAVTDHELKLYILSPQSASVTLESFREPIIGHLGGWPSHHWKPHMGDIWSGLAGYFPYRLTDMLPRHRSTLDWQTVLGHFFGEAGTQP